MITSPKGIDLPVQEMQQLFINELWTDYNTKFYHRVFKNQDRNGNNIPQIHLDGQGRHNKDYEDVRFDDRLDALCWFDVSTSTDNYNLGQINQTVGVFFAVNLNKLYPSLSHRAVEEAHLAVQKILLKRPGEFDIQGIITGEDAYGDYYIGNLKKYNMQPWHVFKFECNVKYSLNC